MTKVFVLLLGVSGALCAAQSTLVTPAANTQQNAEDSQQYAPYNNSDVPQQDNLQRGNYQGGTLPDLNRDVTGWPAQQTQGMPTRPPLSTSRIVGPLRTKSEFQRYAEDATGRRLPVYGRQLFDQVPSTFAPVENVPVPADYVLGPGDQLLIRAWGKIELNSRLTIDRNGQINLPRVGTVTVAGLSYSQVEPYLRSAIGALFKDFELNVTLGQLRTIQIYVLGNARQPGAYTVSSLSTLVDALFSSGGPSATGTMRDIQLRRNDKTIVDFDLYDLIVKGDKSKDKRLLPGDIIFIPVIGPQIAISGDVNQPGIFELKGTTTAGAVIALAGGMTSLASAERAVLERIENHTKRSVEEFSLDEQGIEHQVEDGDLLRVFPLSPKFTNAVTLRGNVAVPGLYPWKEGMRISDLIPSRDALITRDYWNRQNHLVPPIAQRPFSSRRTEASEIQDTYATRRSRTGTMGNQTNTQADQSGPNGRGGYPSSDIYPGNDSYSDGDVYPDNNPSEPAGPGSESRRRQGMDSTESQQTDQSRMSDNAGFGERTGRRSSTIAAVGQNSAEINWEYALIERLDEHDLSTHLIPFRLASAIDNPASADNQLLKPGDVVTIFSRADLELPMEKHATFVRIGGEVNAPGIYRVNPGQTLRDVVKMAGGLTPHSYLFASIFTRESARRAQEDELRQSTEQMQRELVAKFANTVPQPGQTATDQQALLAMQQSALARLAAIKPTGRVVLAMRPSAQTIDDIPDFPLEDGDAFYIPPRLSTVQVAGAVYNANAFRYEEGQRLGRYLDAAGGPTREADSKRIFVIRADGSVVSRQSRNAHFHGGFEKMRLQPGDAIVVPEKLRVSSKLNQFVQWTQLSSQLALTAAAMNILR